MKLSLPYLCDINFFSYSVFNKNVLITHHGSGTAQGRNWVYPGSYNYLAGEINLGLQTNTVLENRRQWTKYKVKLEFRRRNQWNHPNRIFGLHWVWNWLFKVCKTPFYTLLSWVCPIHIYSCFYYPVTWKLRF